MDNTSNDLGGKFIELHVYPEMPEITGHVLLERIENKEGVLFKSTLEGGNIIGITLELFRDSIIPFSIMGDFLTIGTLDFMILGYKSPAVLVCKYLGDRNFD